MKFKEIIKKSNPYLIAEIGVNHENNLNLAEKIIKQAKFGGADAVKFQTYKAETIAAKKSPYYWDLKKVSTKSQYALFKKYEKFNEIDYIKLKKICDHYKIEFLSTPFDTNSALFLNKIVKFFKIASADLTNLMLIDCVCKLKKPILLSTGASNFKEISFINNYIKRTFPKIDVALMHCILAYPTKFKDAHLEIISVLKQKFKNRIIGYSDHTMPDDNGIVLLNAYQKGARVIEKHFTLDKLKGKRNNDHFHAMDYKDFIRFRKNIFILNSINGSMNKRIVLNSEKKSRLNARRSLYSLGAINSDQKLSYNNIIAKRPGGGISPLYYKKIIGKKLKKKVKDEHKFSWKDFSKN
jgi:sialic acid synthase SpsE